MLEVKEVEIPYMWSWGITDGEKWFFYSYTTIAQAEAVLARLTTPALVKEHVSYTRPFQVMDNDKECAPNTSTYLADVVTSEGMRTMYVDLPSGWNGYSPHGHWLGHLEGTNIQRGWLRDWENHPEARAAYMLAKGELDAPKGEGWDIPFNPAEERILDSSDDLDYIRAFCVYMSEYTMLDHYGIRLCKRLPTEQMPKYHENEGAYMVVCRNGSETYSRTWESVYEGKAFFRKGWESAKAAHKSQAERSAREAHLAKRTPKTRKRPTSTNQ